MKAKTKKKWLQYGSFALVFAVLVGVGITLAFISPDEIIEIIGIENSYWVIFLVALLGGVSSFTSTSFFATFATFAAGGSNPFILAALGAIAMMIGDSLFFYLGVRGREALISKHEDKVKKLKDWLEERPEWMIPLIIYVYNGFTPLPADVLMIALALIKYPFKKIVVPMVLGHMTLLTTIGVLAYYGVKIFQ